MYPASLWKARSTLSIGMVVRFLMTTIPALLVIGLLTICSTAAFAQDVFQVNYFSNANTPGAPDGTLRITNPGVTYGNLCALIFVFDADQQLSECCGCVQSHDGLRTLSVNKDLTSNPLTGVKSTNGVIRIVSARFLPPDPCEPSTADPEANLQAFMTHPTEYPNPVPWIVLETESSASTLGAEELTALQGQCAFIKILGSGQGVCTCGTGE